MMLSLIRMFYSSPLDIEIWFLYDLIILIIFQILVYEYIFRNRSESMYMYSDIVATNLLISLLFSSLTCYEWKQPTMMK